jgi:putative ABC transport system permease protein
MDQASLAVQYVFLFALGAGILVMLAVVQSTREERLYESAMLRTLGASKRVVLAGVAVEFAALGLISGILAAAGRLRRRVAACAACVPASNSWPTR